MRVLFVSQEFPPETGWGGIGTYVDVLSEALAAKGVDVHVLSVVDGQAQSIRELDGVTVHRRPLPHLRGAHRPAPEVWRRAWPALNAARLVERLGIDPDVVECPEWMAEGLVLALRGTLPLVVRLHSTARQVFPHSGQGAQLGGADGRVAMWLEESSARRANVVVSTRSNLDEVARWMRLDPGALHAIPYPVRQLPLIPMPDPEMPRVTFVGRLEPRKAPEVVLRAAPAVLARLPQARFTFVGRDGVAPGLFPSARWLTGEAERLGVAHAVELTGHLDRSALIEQLGSATVCAFPSRWESFGNVLAEASSAGRPVVASTIPPFRELVEDGGTGRLAPPEDTAAWSRALIEILSDADRARSMGEAGARRIAGISAPERVADLALASYEHAIERWRRGLRAAASW
jgi:glycogen synthase